MPLGKLCRSVLLWCCRGQHDWEERADELDVMSFGKTPTVDLCLFQEIIIYHWNEFQFYKTLILFCAIKSSLSAVELSTFGFFSALLISFLASLRCCPVLTCLKTPIEQYVLSSARSKPYILSLRSPVSLLPSLFSTCPNSPFIFYTHSLPLSATVCVILQTLSFQTFRMFWGSAGDQIKKILRYGCKMLSVFCMFECICLCYVYVIVWQQVRPIIFTNCNFLPAREEQTHMTVSGFSFSQPFSSQSFILPWRQKTS